MTDFVLDDKALQDWYEAGKADGLEALRPYLAHTDDCDTRKAEPEPCCCGLQAILDNAP